MAYNVYMVNLERDRKFILGFNLIGIVLIFACNFLPKTSVIMVDKLVPGGFTDAVGNVYRSDCENVVVGQSLKIVTVDSTAIICSPVQVENTPLP